MDPGFFLIPRSKRWQSYLPSIIALLISLGILLYVAVWTNSLIAAQQAERESVVAQTVHLAHNTLEPILQQVRSGQITPQQGREQAVELVRRMIYEDQYGDNYIFLVAYDGTMLAQPFFPQNIGKNLWDLQDQNGVYIVRDLVKIALSQPDGGFLQYLYPSPNSPVEEPKLSFVIGLPEIESLIGTGIYLKKFNLARSQMLLGAGLLAAAILFMLSAPLLLAYAQINEQTKKLQNEASARKEAEIALATSEERLRLALDAINDGVWDWQISRNSVYVSPNYYQLLGYQPQEIVFSMDTWIALIHPDDRERAAQDQKNAFIDDHIFSGEYRMRQKNGSYIWILSRGKVVERDEQGNAVRMVGTHTDITERKLAEEALRQSQEKYRIVTENSSDVVWLMNDQFKTIYMSPVIEKQLGYTAEEYLQMTMDQRLPPESYRISMELLRENLQKAQENPDFNTYTYSILHNHKNGQQIWGEVSVTFTRSTDGKITGVVGVTRNIHDRKMAEEALRESETKFKTLYESANDAIFIMDENQYIDCNHRAEEMFGCSRTELIGKTPVDFSPQYQPDGTLSVEIAEQRLQAVLEGTPQVFEWLHHCPGGREFFAEVSLNPIELNHRRLVQGIVRDVTDRIQKMIALQVSEERFRTVIEQLSDGFILIDDEGKILEWNSAQEKITGLKKEVVLGRHIWDVQKEMRPPDKRDTEYVAKLREIAQKIMQNDIFTLEVVPLEMVIISASGQRLILEQTIFPIVTHSGNRVGSIIRDVTETRSAQQRIQQQVNKLRALREIDQHITTRKPVDDTLHTVLQQAHQYLHADGVNILLLSEQGDHLLRQHSLGLAVDVFECPGYSQQKGLAWQAVQNQSTVQCRTKDGLNSEPACDCLQTYGVQMVIATPLVSSARILGVMEAYLFSPDAVDQEWVDYFETLAGQAAIAIDTELLIETLTHSNQDLKVAYESTITGWSKALELRDKETKGHSDRVMDLSVKLALRLGFSSEQMKHFRRGVLLHDIGKMGIPDNILLKPGPLSDDEWMIMRQHPVFAYQLLKDIPYLRPALDVPYCHHERWDGSGYPRGLKGTEIPLEARIFAVVDVWDALISDRPYRPALPPSEVRHYLQQQAGKLFDPDIVQLFLELIEGGISQ